MGFEGRQKGRYKVAGELVERIKEIQKKVKAVLKRVQEEIKQYADRKRKKGNEYQKGDLVMLSTKDLKQQIKRRRIEKLIKQFIGLYKVKRVISMNAIKFELPLTIKIHLVVNVSTVKPLIRHTPQSWSKLVKSMP